MYLILSLILLQLNGAVVAKPKVASKTYTITCTMVLTIPPTGNPTTTNAVCTAVPR